MMSKRIKILFLNSLALVLVVLVFVLCAEGVVRVFRPDYNPSGALVFQHLADGTPLAKAGTKQRLIKNTGDYNVEVEINNLGLRESKPLTSSDSKSIFAVGDSFTFGWGVEESGRYSNKVETLLNRKVFNIGMPTGITGFGKLLAYAEKNGAKISTVIVGVSMETDLQIYDKNGINDADVNIVNTTNSKWNFLKIKEYLKDNSALYFLVTSLIHSSSFLHENAARLGLLIPNGANLNAQLVGDKEIESSVGELAKLVQNKKHVVLVIPSRALWMGKEEDRQRTAWIHDAFLNALLKNHINYVDMRRDFESSGNPLQYHFKQDGHWNSLGHLLAAKKLAEYILIGAI